MKPFRNLKIASVIEHELSKMLVRDYSIDNALVTIVGVEVSEDLMQAKVRLSIVPYIKGPEAFLLIDGKKRNIEHTLLRKMNIRPMPHLKFEIEEHEEDQQQTIEDNKVA